MAAISRILLLLTLTSIAVSASAQSSGPKEFYQNNYAAAPSEKGAGVAADAGPVGQGGASGAISGVSPRAGGSQGSAGSVQAVSGVQPKGRKLIASVYVNSADAKHLSAVLDVVSQLVDQNRIFVPVVYHMGDYRNVTPQMEAALTQRGIILIPISTLDDIERPVTLSPAWFISSKEGTHLVEGVINLAPLISPFGDFDPKGLSSADSPNLLQGF